MGEASETKGNIKRVKTLQKTLTHHLASEETIQNMWCLLYSGAIVAAYVFTLKHLI